MLKIFPHELSEFQVYGKWNSLSAFNPAGELIETIPAHDGDFFPESPLDHIAELKKHIHRGEAFECSYWPVRVDIDITQNCSDNCYFCYSRPYTNLSDYKNAQIDVDNFERIVKELADNGTKTIRFTGGGEPLIHPQIKEILTIPKTHGLKSCILTNGSLLNEELCEVLVNNLDQIRISLNAASNQTRSKIHRSKANANSLTEIFKLIQYTRKLRDNKWPNQRRPLIWTTYLILPENINEIEQAIIKTKESGADSISFRPIYHNLANRIQDVDENNLISKLQELKTKFSDDQFHIFSPKRDLSSVWNILPSNCFSNCISSRLRTIIETTKKGQLIKICGLHRGSRGESLGILKAETLFKKVWLDPMIKEMLKTKPKTCDHCIDISMNITLNKINNILERQPDTVFYKSFSSNI